MESDFQPCLRHPGRTVKSGLPREEQRPFTCGCWEVRNGLDRREVRTRPRRFMRRWEPIAPGSVETFRAHFEQTPGYLQFPAEWRRRVRAVNLTEGFFRSFRRFFSRFPGFQDEAHLSRAMGLCPLGAKPERWFSSGRSRAWRRGKRGHPIERLPTGSIDGARRRFAGLGVF